jgi:hypothetical protein
MFFSPYPAVLTSPRSNVWQGRSLEEIDEIFADAHPVKASLRKQKVIVPLDQ